MKIYKIEYRIKINRIEYRMKIYKIECPPMVRVVPLVQYAKHGLSMA